MATDPTGYISIPLELTRGMSWKRPVRVAATGNLTLSGTQTIDGVACVAGDRVLAKSQTTGSQRGIYVVAAGAWTRAFDMDQDLTTAVPAEESLGAMVIVLEGTANGGTIWRCTNTGTVILGTTTLTFAQFTGVSLSTATPLVESGAGSAGSGTAASKDDHVHPAASGSSLTVEEVDGSPTDAAITKIVFPNGTLAIASHVATYTPAGVGASGAAFPSIVQTKFAGTAVSSLTLDSAPVSGHSVLLYIDASNTADPTSITSTNTTWTKIKSVSAGAKYSLWVGVVSGTGGTSITITHANAFLSAYAIEVADTLTATLGTSGSGATNTTISTAGSATAGHLVAVFIGTDNTTGSATYQSTLPLAGFTTGIVVGGVGYSAGYVVQASMYINPGTIMIAEIT